MSTFCQRVPVSTMRAEDDAAFRQRSTHGRRDRLFADVGVTRAEHEALLMAACEFFFRLPDDLHRAVQRKQLVIGHWLLAICDWVSAEAVSRWIQMNSGFGTVRHFQR